MEDNYLPNITVGYYPWATNWTNPVCSEVMVPTTTSSLFAGLRRKTSIIVDEPTRAASTSDFKPCFHHTTINELSGSPIRYVTSYGGMSNHYLQGVNSTDLNWSEKYSPVDYDMGAYADQALAYMLPHLNEGTSLVNFLLELKDLKSWKHITDVGMRLRGLSQRKWKSRKFGGLEFIQTISKHASKPYTDLMYRTKAGRRLMSRDIMKRLTGAHLEASFGIVPFIGDLYNMHIQLAAFSHRLEMLKQHASRRLVRHYRYYLPLQGGAKSSTVGDVVSSQRTFTEHGNSYSYSLISTERWVKRPVYHATVRYSYELPDMGEAESKVKAYLDTLGVRLDPSIVWNAIPYTFLVDWIADVGDFLRSFARDNYPINTTISEFCHSVSYHRMKSLGAVMPFPPQSAFSPPYWQGGPFDNAAVCEFFSQDDIVYDRRVGHTTDISSISVKRPKLKQLALSGSLLVNKLLGGSNTRYRR